MTINTFPLDWPQSWKRTAANQRKPSQFSTKQRGYQNRHLTISDGVSRVLTEFERMGVSEDNLIISTNVKPRLDGLPRSGERGLMTHMLPRAARAVEPWLRKHVTDARFWEDEYDTRRAIVRAAAEIGKSMLANTAGG